MIKPNIDRIPTIIRRLLEADRRGDTVAAERIRKILAEVGCDAWGKR